MIEEPISISERAAREGSLPTSILYNVPFPSSTIPGQFVPFYEKTENVMPPDFLIDYARKPAKILKFKYNARKRQRGPRKKIVKKKNMRRYID